MPPSNSFILLACCAATATAMSQQAALSRARSGETHGKSTYAMSTNGVEVFYNMQYLGLLPPEGTIDVAVAGDRLFLLGRTVAHNMLRIYQTTEGEVPKRIDSYSGLSTEAEVHPIAVKALNETAIFIAAKNAIYAIDLIERTIWATAKIDGCKSVSLLDGAIAVIDSSNMVSLFSTATLERLDTVRTHGLPVVLSSDETDRFFTVSDECWLEQYQVTHDFRVKNIFSKQACVVFPNGSHKLHYTPTTLEYDSDRENIFFSYGLAPCSVYGCGVVFAYNVAAGTSRKMYTPKGDILSVSHINASHLLSCSESSGCAVVDLVSDFFEQYANDRVVENPVPGSVENPEDFMRDHMAEIIAAVVLFLMLIFAFYLRRLLKENERRRNEANRQTVRGPEDHNNNEEVCTPQALPPQPYGEDLTAPEHMVCPISLEIMVDPVVCVDGYHNFERYHIERFLSKVKSECPVSRQAMCAEDIKENTGLKKEILEWVNENRAKTGKDEHFDNKSSEDSDSCEV
eukprot:TRINITY_DN37538_c0_g1_i1.p1 TRINITY_DN37538_c0_g1~~TRINITY_DN37538_c0_g1_i1.p1  ORF type:complete len:514 (+),score=38.97 TRINITY_DN37538_c0_g1_i1:43-1584(+)